MRPIARKLVLAALLLLVPLAFGGCIVSPCWWCDERPPRTATLHVYVYDDVSYAPIPWAVVDLYAEDWWSWDYLGSWGVTAYGYAALTGGYLYYEGRGGPEEENYRIEVRAPGYYRETFDIGLDYWHPSESVYFYLLPYRGSSDDGSEKGLPPDARPPDRVTTGEPRAGAPAGGD
jgi:hypothetical protein